MAKKNVDVTAPVAMVREAAHLNWQLSRLDCVEDAEEYYAVNKAIDSLERVIVSIEYMTQDQFNYGISILAEYWAAEFDAEEEAE